MVREYQGSHLIRPSTDYHIDTALSSSNSRKVRWEMNRLNRWKKFRVEEKEEILERERRSKRAMIQLWNTRVNDEREEISLTCSYPVILSHQLFCLSPFHVNRSPRWRMPDWQQWKQSSSPSIDAPCIIYSSQDNPCLVICTNNHTITLLFLFLYHPPLLSPEKCTHHRSLTLALSPPDIFVLRASLSAHVV